MYNELSIAQNSLLIASLAAVITAILIFSKKPKFSLILVCIAAGLLGAFVANLDPFLNVWDEQFHALVAKNMVLHPSQPMLYTDPALAYDYTNWTANHIWLHKQPLFLWQMALSIKLFGANELAVRIPSILMHAFMPIMIYRIGKHAISAKVGFIGALLIAVAFFPLEQISGGYSTDHNDVAFLFYVTASFMAWFEYRATKNWKWLILIGVFSGCAVLTKWLVGLLVFACWGIAKFIADKETRWKLRSYLPMLASMGVAAVIFLPWHIYIRISFPKEAAFESKMMSEHLYRVIENHSGGTWFHFTEGLSTIYGTRAIIPFILLAGIIVLLWKSKNLATRLFIGSSVVIVYGLYTFAATKMIAYPIIVLPFVYLGMAALINFVFQFAAEKIKLKWMILGMEMCVLFVVLYLTFDPKRIHSNHIQKDLVYEGWEHPKLLEMRMIDELSAHLEGNDWVVFVESEELFGHVPIMFYTDFTAYPYFPGKTEIATLLSKKKKIAVVNPSEELKNDPRITAITVSGN